MKKDKLIKKYDKYIQLLGEVGGALTIDDFLYLFNVKYKNDIENGKMRSFNYDKIARDFRNLNKLLDEKDNDFEFPSPVPLKKDIRHYIEKNVDWEKYKLCDAEQNIFFTREDGQLCVKEATKLGYKEVNEFFLLGEKYKSGIFSHNTALYFYDLTDRTPLKLDMTFPERVTIHDDTIKAHYTKEKFYNIGVKNMKLQDGTTIKIYDMERTICDIIRARNKIDPQILNTAIQEYFKRKDNDYILLMKYAKIFRIEKILRNYMEVI